MILAVDKPAGWTPLDALDALRVGDGAAVGRPDLAAPVDEPMVYAGRLDPMAEGVLLVLTGEDRHALDAFLALDKEYVAAVLFGVSSDTHDALGRLSRAGVVPPPEGCAEAVVRLVGAPVLPLPAWSAYRVRGRPLHAWAREGRLAEIERPVRAMRVAAVEILGSERVTAGALLADVANRIGRVRGEFRQAAALGDWAALVAADPPLVTVRARFTVGSGTYVRALAEHVGALLGCGALLLALRRTRVGRHRLPDG